LIERDTGHDFFDRLGEAGRQLFLARHTWAARAEKVLA
jgi:hypothetical protein